MFQMKNKTFLKPFLLRSLFAFFSLDGCDPARTHPDEVIDLPGLNFPINFKQYSGYLNATSGKCFHYWFVESQGSPTSDPVVLWLNGGPGCSSVSSLLSENGPFYVSKDGKTLNKNTFSWNRIANVIFLESPAGVGFSYSNDKQYNTDDDKVSEDNYAALQHFFQKFPAFKQNNFYITGQSYASVYISTLSLRILENPVGINLQGIAIGNGFLSQVLNQNSQMFFAYYHGLISTSLWDNITEHCCTGTLSPENCYFAVTNNVSTECKVGTQKVLDVIERSRLNAYNLYLDCPKTPSNTSEEYDAPLLFGGPPQQLKEKEEDSKYSLCFSDSLNTRYLNRVSVRDALHIPSDVQNWSSCSETVEKGYKVLYMSLQFQIKELVDSGKLRSLFYNGDVDMVCNFLGNQWFLDSLGFPITKEYTPWNWKDQIAGFFKNYGNMTYLTVKGAGHLVPQTKPGQAFKMISTFLNNKSFD